MSTPEAIHEIVDDVVEQYPHDSEAAVQEACRRVADLPDYQTWVDGLARQAVRLLVSNKRHANNVAIKKARGDYGKPAKVVQGAGAVVEKVHREIIFYNYAMRGTSLGQLYGRDFADIIAHERNKERGHRFNVVLLEKLRPLVPDDKQVSKALTNKRLGGVFAAAAREAGYDPLSQGGEPAA